MNIGIIGGGMMGLATAFYLSRSGMDVTIFEKDKQIGGLSRSDELLPGFRWDRFYHVILTTDKELLEFLDELGLLLDVEFRETKTGFYTNGQLHSMSTTTEFLKFKPLSLLDKLRLGAGIFYASKINNWQRLEKLYVKTWLIRIFGRRNYEKMWGPLLRSKLGSANEQASAAFIWGIIKRLYGSRQSTSKKEMAGCVHGGYHSILFRIKEKLAEKGVKILINNNITRIESTSNERLLVHARDGNPYLYDKLISTIPNPELLNIWPDISESFKNQLQKIQYLKLVCVSLVLKNKLSPYYVTNLTDSGIPFTGIIDATNIIPPDILQGKALVYLPKYIPSQDEFYEKTEKEILAEFISALKIIFPTFSDDDIIASYVHREPFVQPIQDVNYSTNIPPMETPIKNLYMVNTSMILNSTLNNNQVIKLARKMALLLTNN